MQRQLHALPLLTLGLIAGCQNAGEGSSCDIANNADGTSTISCTDGSTVTLRGDDTCTVTTLADASTISCDDGSSVTLSASDSWTVADNGNGTVTLTRAGASVVVDSGLACAMPTAPFGTSEGSNFLPFELTQCDGTSYSFYNDEYCEASYTVVMMQAGWCNPCRVEATLMEQQLTQRYASQGVRVVAALIQNNDYNAPSTDFCQGWVDQYGLTNTVVIDPSQETQIYFPAGALPATLIVDSNGVIRHREYGVSTELMTVRAALDELLAGE